MAIVSLAIALSVVAAPGSGVVINNVALKPAELSKLERSMGVKVRPGRYWYDSMCGAWGLQGSGAIGFMAPGLTAPPLRADASGGGPGGGQRSQGRTVPRVVTGEDFVLRGIAAQLVVLPGHGNGGLGRFTAP